MANSANQRSTYEPLAFGALVLLGLLIYAVIGYVYFRPQVIGAVLAFRHLELSVIGAFTDRYDSLDTEVLTINRSELGLADLWHLGNAVGGIYAGLGAGLLVLLAGAVCLIAPRHRYQAKIRNIDDLIIALPAPFRYARAYLGRNRILRDPELGKRPTPGDMALNVPEWIAAYGRDGYGAFNEDLARVALESQLGPVWTGPRTAAPHVRCLFAALTVYANRNRSEADTYAGDLATSLPPGNGDALLNLPERVVAAADVILADEEATRPCVIRAARHAYTAPAMLACLEYARSRVGVLNNGIFNWLKLVDRPLWYVLVMPCNPFVEGAGARAHYIAETIAEMPLYTPQVEPALEGVCARHGQIVSGQRR